MELVLIAVIATFIVFIILIFYVISVYNQLVQLKVNVEKSWANINVLLKQRYDEIPKLVKVCEGYMKYERETLEKIINLRTSFLQAKTPNDIAKVEGELSGALKNLFAVAENYPQLKANDSFMQLQNRISYLENQIADRREFYNDSVMIYNARIEQIPYVFVAKLINYGPRDMFMVSEAEKKIPDIEFQFPKQS